MSSIETVFRNSELQTLMERLPRLRVSILGRNIPSWHAWGVAGLALGTLLFMRLSLWAEGEATPAFMLVGAGYLSILLLRRISRRVFGYYRGVLFENLIPILALNLVILKLLDVPMGNILDRWALGVTAFLAVGRIGCLLTGCCHGKPAGWGMVYPWIPTQYAHRVRDQIRFLPVQAFESLLCGLLLASELIVYLGPHQPGDVLGLFLAGYAAGRFGLEYLRGDPRPHRLGLSEAQWTSCGLLASMLFTFLAIPSLRTIFWFSLLTGAVGAIAILIVFAPGALSNRHDCESRP